MKPIKEYEMTDNIGLHKVKEYSNGICVKILKDPSKEYAQKIKKREEEAKMKREIELEKQARDKLISSKIRELAIKELEKEGKL